MYLYPSLDVSGPSKSIATVVKGFTFFGEDLALIHNSESEQNLSKIHFKKIVCSICTFMTS